MTKKISNKFDDMCELIDKTADSDDYFPTVEELKAHNIEEHPEYVIFLFYLLEKGIPVKTSEYLAFKEYADEMINKYIEN